MSGFKFPPPPPPPPKATGSSTDAPLYTSSQRGGGRGRGYNGRGGNNNQRGGRGGRGGPQYGGRGNHHHDGGQPSRGRGGPQYNGPRHQNQYSQNRPLQQATSSPVMPANPATPFTNPLFGIQPSAHPQPQLDPAAYAQALAFMSTPAGLQAMSAVASQMSAGVAPQSPPAQPRQSNPHQQQGTKRKWNDRADRPQYTKPQNAQQPSSKPQKAKSAPAPAVPSFGFALPTAPSAKPSAPSNKTKQKRKVNLGLTARAQEEEVENVPDEEQGGEDDEEAALASSMGISGAVFEHDGQRISLQTPAELQAWIKDRRKQYPTRKRAAEKAREAAEQRAKELEFLKKMTGDYGAGRTIAEGLPTPRPKKVVERSREEEQDQNDLAQLRQRHNNMLAKNATEVTNGANPIDNTMSKSIDLGLGYDSGTDSEDDDESVLSDSSVVSSDDESAEEPSDEDDSESDAPPEEESSKTAPPPIMQPPPVSLSALPQKAPKKHGPKVCFSWEQTGQCKFGRKCRFPHPPKEEPKRKTLYEVMVENELEERDRETLNVIKWLGQNGYLG